MAQGKDDGAVPLTPDVGTDYASGNAPAPRGRCRHKLVHVVAWVFLLLNVIALYVLHFVDTGASHADTVAGEFQTHALSSSSTDAKKGLAVSYGADGKLRVGAGTTAYLDAAALPEDPMAYMQLAPMGTSEARYATNLVAYSQGSGATLKTMVTTISADADAKTVRIASPDAKNTLAGTAPKSLATLSDTLAVVLTTVSSADGLQVSAYTTPISIADTAVTLDTAHKVLAANSSATNFVGALGATAFAHVLYEPYSMTAAYYQRVQVGSVGSDGAITFSKSVVFGRANSASVTTTFGQPHKVLATGARFAVPWFVDSSSATSANSSAGSTSSQTKSPGLCISTFSFESGAVTAGADLCSTKYAPAYFVDATKLSDNVLALAFVDTANANALTVATIEYSAITYLPSFRSVVTIDAATGKFDFGASAGFYPEPSLQVLSDDRVAVGFLNPSNTGKPSFQVLAYSSDLAWSTASPVLPVANADFTLATADAKAFGSVVLHTLAVPSGFVLAFGGRWAGKQYQRVSLVESFGAPVGVITATGSDLRVAMAGTTSVAASLEAGQAYYAATSGQLYTPSSTTASHEYVVADDDQLVLSRSALLGVAVSGSKLFISAQANN
jgi:hypothetical protein